MSTFGALSLPNRPTLPHMNDALVQIGRQLEVECSDSKELFKPFGAIEGFLFKDPAAEMIKSVKVPLSGVGILRFESRGTPGLADLPEADLRPAARSVPSTSRDVASHIRSD